MSDVIIFCGPTLAGVGLPSAVRRQPPAALGDMLAAAPKVPSTLILIDGLFGRQRSPWHKEILTLLSAGHRVVGAASMGALRACELHQFGMIGVGVVFRAYRRGVLIDDGDVAVAHAPAELGWRQLSVAMVDVLTALGRTRHAGAVDHATACVIYDRARAMSFKDRSWSKMLDGLPISGELVRMLAAAPSTKQADALRAVEFALHDSRWPLPPPAPPSTRWERFLP
ncbi:TfuA-like protein [Polymorphobacter fuscus]|nr:TfuA-like protein [Polymorphobacter fuscus]NJC07018.1 hypothetical protein [Polymorphobacter fuscus]